MKRKLVSLANKLDCMGLHGHAGLVDSVLKKIAEELSQENMPTQHIAINDFVKRQTKESNYSYLDGSWNELISLVEQNFAKQKPGYRPGVILVPVPPDRFYTSVAKMTEGTKFTGEYKPRKPGEKPYMQMMPAGLNKIPAKSAEIVLYSHDALAEGKENSTNAEWEIISINASPWEGKEGESEPMHPEALMRNYFKEPGGTEMKGVTPEQFIEMLRTSRDYWHDKTMVG